MSELSASTLLPGAEAFLTPAESPKRQRAQRRLMNRFALMLADIVAIQAGTVLASFGVQLVQGKMMSGMLWTPLLGAAAALAVLAPAAVLGLHDAVGVTPLERFRLRVYVGAILPWPSLALVGLMQSVTIEVAVILGISALLYVPLALLTEASIRQMLLARSAWGADVLLIGSGEVAERVASDLLAHPEAGMRPIGYCGDPTPPEICLRLPRLAAFGDVDSLANIADIAVVVPSPKVSRIDLAQLPFDRIIIVPDLDNIPVSRARTLVLGGSTAIDFTNPAQIRANLVGKRLLDLVVAAPALLIALPLILGTALAIRILSPGPAFYVQSRIGWRGRPVAIFKLRSMYHDADRRLEALLRNDPAARQQWDTYVKLSRDPRVLSVIGSFIRRTSIDELPQLWNVVRGDISLVGPRPFPAYHVEKFGPEFQKLRCSVRPGLTGLWQVSMRNCADLRQQEAIDTFYIRNWSLWLDLYIVFRTLPAMLSGRGAR
jgi:exopolysaccharide biosynthesis polyprenyl glycosylphosphotransferase